MTRIATAAIAFAFWSSGSLAQVPGCSDKQGDAADAAADHLKSWDAVAAYVRSYRRCDDGGTAEITSEAVARLLVDHWTTLPNLADEARRTPHLRSFVLSHVNATLDTIDIQKIRLHADHDCPSADNSLCRDLSRAAASALD